MTISATPLLKPTIEALSNPRIRYIVHVGSTRSSKTYSILQALILTATQQDVEIDVFRKQMRVLRSTAYDDFIKILKEYELYREEDHDKTKAHYQFTGRIRFAGADQASKLRGMQRDILWCNEANELEREDWRQLKRRTRDTVILDYNPTQAESHWISDVLEDPRTRIIRSTYKCNPYLPDAQIEDIESDVPVYKEADGTLVEDWDLTYKGEGRLVKGDPVQWSIYGLGIRATSPHLILQKRTTIPDADMPDPVAYGLDFGFTHPMALVSYAPKDVTGEAEYACFHELLYETGFTTEDLIKRMQDMGIDKDVPIYADHDPEKIAAIEQAGFTIEKANKSVNAGLDWLQSKMFAMTESSTHLQDEAERYRRKPGSEKPVKKDDHGIDACRMAGFTHNAPTRENPDWNKSYSALDHLTL
jgi:phage terminase large subunit